MPNNQTSVDQTSDKDKLYMVLLEEIHAYQYMADTVKQKQEAIIKNQLEDLENLTGVERLLVNKVEVLLKAREQYLQKVTAHDGASVTIRLNEFISRLSEQEQPRWRSIEQRIYRIVEKIRRLNLENQQLIRSSLNYINGLVEMLYPQDDGAKDLYNSAGKEDTHAAVKPIVNFNV